MRLAKLASCAELTIEDAEEAASSSSKLRELLEWASRIARPGEGAPKVLMAVARLARADWVEGSPYVEIGGDESVTTLAVVVDHGSGIRETLLPRTRIPVPCEEFERAIRLAPQLVAPFRPVYRDGTILLATDDVNLEAHPEAVEIADSSLHEQARKTAPPPKLSEISRRAPYESGVHTHPTVRRMVVVRPEALRQGNGEGSD